MKTTYYIARTMINGEPWDLCIFSSMPKMNIHEDHEGCSIMFEGDKLFNSWNLEQLLPNICPEKGSVFKISVDELEDGSYMIERLKL